MCANISYIMMTLNRYLLVGKDHPPWLVTTAKLDINWVIRGSLFFSALINIGQGWRYEVVEATDVSIINSSPYYYFYNSISGESYSDYPQANQGTPFFVYSVVHFCINFGIFFFLNTGLEIKIVRRMQKELEEKRKRLVKMNSAKPVGSNGNVLQKISEDKIREEEDEKKERKVIKMVVINGILNFVLRAPDMLFWMENNNFWSIFKNTLVYTPLLPGFLAFIPEIGYITYILTFSSNFFIFYKFNKNFNDAVMFFWTSKSNKT
jgi:hypothetical protein